jgi:hypothetical protein
MAYRLRFKLEAKENLYDLKIDPSAKKYYKSVLKCLKYMEQDLRHPSLATHEFKSKKGQNGEKIFEAYAPRNRPAAYRVFWHYGPNRGELTIVAITSHP